MTNSINDQSTNNTSTLSQQITMIQEPTQIYSNNIQNDITVSPNSLFHRRIEADPFSLSSSFWDVLFQMRRSLISNALILSVIIDIFNLVQLGAVIFVIIYSYEDSCDIPLRSFLYFYVSRIGFSILLAFFFYVDRGLKLFKPTLIRTLDFLKLAIDVLTIAIIVCGNYLVFIKNECQFTSPSLFYTSFALIVINYLTIAFPIFLLITLLLSGRFYQYSAPNTPIQIGIAPEELEKMKLRKVKFLPCTEKEAEEGQLDLPFSPVTSDSRATSPVESIFTVCSRNGSSLVVFKHVDSHHCTICLDLFKEGENIRKLNCSHYFHQDCIDEWLKNHCTCPLCKFSYPAKNRNREEERVTRPQRSGNRFLQFDSFLSLTPPTAIQNHHNI